MSAGGGPRSSWGPAQQQQQRPAYQPRMQSINPARSQNFGSHAVQALPPNHVGVGGGHGSSAGQSIAAVSFVAGTLSRRLKTLRKPVQEPRLNPRELYSKALDCVVYPVVEAQASDSRAPGAGAPPPGGSAASVAAAAGTGGAASSGTHQSHSSYLQSFLDMDSITGKSSTVAVGDTVRIATISLKKFRDNLANQARALNSIGASQLDNRSRTFVLAIQRLLNSGMSTSNMAKFTDMKALIAEISRVCTECIPASAPPKQFDQTLFLTTRLFIATLNQAIQSAEPRSKAVSHPLFKADEYKAIVARFSKTTSETREDLGGLSTLVDGLRDIFQMPQNDHNQACQEARRRRSEVIVFYELKSYLDDLSRDRLPGYTLADFLNSDAYGLFKKCECARIQGFMHAYALRYPAVLRTPLPSDQIPSAPSIDEAESMYRALVEFIFNAEFNSGREGVTNLSKMSKSILSECAFRWRVSKDFKEIVVFEEMVRKYNEGKLILEDLYPKFKEIRKIVTNHDQMRFRDANLLVSIYEKIHQALLRQVQLFLEFIHLKDMTPEDCNNTLLLCSYMLKEINDESLWRQRYPEANNPEYIRETICKEIWEAAIRRYRVIITKLEKVFPDEDKQTIRLTKLVQAIKSDLTKYRTYFSEPFLGNNHIHMIAGEAYLKTVNGDVMNIHYFGLDADITQMLDLYTTVRDLYDLCDEEKIESGRGMQIDDLFAPYIDQWLTRTDAKWIEWVVRAYELDKKDHFAHILPPSILNSASVLDLFTSFQSGLDFMAQFNFKDTKRKEKLARNFIKAMSKALQEYCRLMYSEFDALNQSTDDKKTFTRESCVRSNNIFAAQMNLRKVLEALEVSDKAAMLVSTTAKRIEPDPKEHVYDIKIVRANGIESKIWATPDTYVILKVNGAVLGSTRVVCGTRSPIWNEVATARVASDASVQAYDVTLTIMNSNNLGFDTEYKTASFSLSDATFDDFLSHDLKLAMNPGTLIVRLRKVGEVDDTAWYIKRAEELLRFAIEDMLQIYVRQFTHVVKVHLDQIIAATAPSKFWGLSFTQKHIQVTDESIEKAMRPMLVQIDHMLSIFNENVDRRFEEQLFELYPFLANHVHTPESTHASARRAHGSVSARATGGGLVTAVGDHVRIDRPPAMISLIWHEILRAFEIKLMQFGRHDTPSAVPTATKANLHTTDAAAVQTTTPASSTNASFDVPASSIQPTTFNGVTPLVHRDANKQTPSPTSNLNRTQSGTPIVITNDEKRQTHVFENVIEYLKALFYCDVEGNPVGLPLQMIETDTYIEVRALLAAYSSGSGQSKSGASAISAPVAHTFDVTVSKLV